MTSMVSWQMFQAEEPFRRVESSVSKVQAGEVVIEVAGCGVCHTDLGFYYDGVKTKSHFPLTLGHEISGIIIDSGSETSKWIGKAVIIPAVMPCGICDVCLRGLGNICPYQKMPGNDINGGFASHIVVPANQLCEVSVDNNLNPVGDIDISLAELSVIADAITTPYQAIKDSKLTPNDLAIFIGVGGVGSFGVQIAKAIGACVIAIDIDQNKLDLVDSYVDASFNSSQMNFKDLRKSLSSFVKKQKRRMTEWKIFETSGSSSGQKTAFGLLTFGAHLSIVGFTMETLDVKLSKLMAFHATAKGNWGCLPSYYPAVLDLVLSGQVNIRSFVKMFPLSEINSVFKSVHEHQNNCRAILVP